MYIIITLIQNYYKNIRKKYADRDYQFFFIFYLKKITVTSTTTNFSIGHILKHFIIYHI